MESEHAKQTGVFFFLMFRSEMRLKTFLEGCNEGDLREWREENTVTVGFFRQSMNERSN